MGRRVWDERKMRELLLRKVEHSLHPVMDFKDSEEPEPAIEVVDMQSANYC